jgi:hypothetical protein
MQQINLLKFTAMKTTIQLLRDFAHQRPNLNFADYGDVKAYRSESREIIKDLHDFNELFSLAFTRIDNLNEQLTDYLTKSSGRLTLENGKLQYCTGQYFPTEYRAAANRVLADLIFADYREETNSNDPNKVYATGHEIRKAISRKVSRRVMKNYFN